MRGLAEAIFREDKDGKLALVGDFDRVYREAEDPWDQSGGPGPMAAYYDASRCRLASTLKDHLRYAGTRLEIGCGHGHALEILSMAVRGGNWHGLDVSRQAIAQARKLYPRYRFFVGDITGKLPAGVFRDYDAVILNQALWYVLERLDETLANCQRLMRLGGLLCISQGFLPLTAQRYGREIAHGFNGAMQLLNKQRAWRLIEAKQDDTGRHRLDDGLFVLRRIK